jgi:hypothetical protein
MTISAFEELRGLARLEGGESSNAFPIADADERAGRVNEDV